MRRLMIRARSVWILLGAVAVLLFAVGYVLFAMVRLARDEASLLGVVPEPDGPAEPDGLAAHAAVVMQFSGPIPALLVLLAVMLLAGCMVLAPPRTLPVTDGNTEVTGGSRLRLGLVSLAAVAALLALTCAAIAALTLSIDSSPTEDLPGLQVLLRTNSVTALAISLAALGLLVAVFLSERVSDHLAASPTAQDEQDGAAAGPTSGPASETTEAGAQTSQSSSADLIEGGQRSSRGQRRHPPA